MADQFDFSSVGGQPVSDQAESSKPPVSSITPVTAPPAQPSGFDFSSVGGQKVSDMSQDQNQPAVPETSAWTKLKSRFMEPVKAEEIERIPGLQPNVVQSLQETGQDTLGSIFGKERGDYIREHILHGFTPEVDARAAAKTLTDWYSPAMLAMSAPGRIAHGYAAAAEAASKIGDVAKAAQLAGKARLSGILGTVSGVPFVGRQVTDLVEHWSDMTPVERTAALSGVLGGSTMMGVGIHEAGGPKEVAKGLAAPIVKGAESVAGAAGAVTSGVKKGLGLGDDFYTTVKKISPPSKGYAMEYADTLKKAEPQLREVMQKNPDVGTPQDLYDAIDKHITQNDAFVASEAAKFKGKPEAQMTGIENKVRSDLNKSFDENPGQYKPEEREKAISAVMNHVLQETPSELEGGVTYREPDLSEAEGIRQRFNQDTKPSFGSNAPAVPPAENFAKQVANRSLRAAIDQKFDDLGVNKVKEYRQQEAPLIDVRDQIADAVKKSDEMGTYNVFESLTKQLGWKTLLGIAAGAAGGPETAAGGAIAASGLGAVADYIRDLKLNPNRKVIKAAKQASEGGPSGAALPTNKPTSPAGSAAPTPAAAPVSPEAAGHLEDSINSEIGKDLEIARNQNATPEERRMAMQRATENTKRLEELVPAKIQQRKPPGDNKEFTKGAVNPLPATEGPGPGSLELQTGRKPNETETQYQKRLQKEPAQPLYQYKLPKEPAIIAPAEKRPIGFLPGDELDHEWGHITNAALEGWSTGGIESHLNESLGKNATAAAVVIPRDVDFNDPESVARNAGRILSTVLSGAVANELRNRIPFEINRGISSDLGVLKRVFQNKKFGDAAFSDSELEDAIKYGRDRAKRNLTQPGIDDILTQNVKVREENLHPGMHASPERTEAYGGEVRRIQDANRQQAGRAIQGNGERISGPSGEINRIVDTGTNGEVQKGRYGTDQEARGKVSPEQKMVEDAGLVYKGELAKGSGVHLFEHPEFKGMTASLNADEMTPESVRAKMASKLTDFGVKPKVAEHPIVTALKEKYGSSTNSADMTKGGASFLHADGTVTNIGSNDHPAAISSVTGKGAEDIDRTDFINDTGSIRVRHRPTAKRGPEIVFSVPEKGVTPEQVDMMRQAVGKMGRNGNLLIEAARTGEEPSETVRSWPENKVKEFARPSDVEPMLREIGAHPEQHGKIDLETTKEDWAKKAEEDAKAQGGGFTINPRTGEAPTTGYMVEAHTEGRPEPLGRDATAADIQKVYDDNKALFDKYPELHVGGYKGELNISARTDNLEAAKELGKRLDQISIFDLKNGEEIPTGGTSKKTSFPDYPLEQRLADLRGGKMDLETSREDNKNFEKVHEDYLDRQDSVADDIISEYNENIDKDGYRQSWDLVPAARLKKIWNDYAKLGFVRDEAGIDRIADTILENIHKIHVNNVLTGHSEEDPADLTERTGGERHDLDHFNKNDTFFDDDKGQWRISDYAAEPLARGAADLMLAKTAEDKLQAIDHILNITHARSDLASWFVEGGQKTLNQLAGKETGATGDTEFEKKLHGLASGRLDLETSREEEKPAGSTVPLMKEPLKIKGTGEEGRVNTLDVAKALNKFSKNANSRLDLNKADPEEMTARAKSIMEDEARYQLAQANTGEAWYTTQIADHDKILQEMRPELTDPAKLSMFKMAEAIASAGQKPYQNLKTALKIWDVYNKTGEFPPVNPETKLAWGPRAAVSYGNALNSLTRLVQEKGEQGASDWLQDKHPVSELKEYNKNVAGRKDAEVLGAQILGPKRGPFAMNLHGKEAEFTADMWVSRSWNRWMGTIETDPEEGILTDAPRSGKERDLMKQSFEETAKKLDMTTSSLQAVLWYYEQSLYSVYGVPKESWSFSDAAKHVQQEEEVGPQGDLEEEKLVEKPKSISAMDFINAMKNAPKPTTAGQASLGVK